MIRDPLTIAVTETVEVGVQAGERDLLLAAWLNELIYLFEVRRVLFNEFEILEMDDTHLRARASGEALDPARHVLCGGVKAADAASAVAAAGRRRLARLRHPGRLRSRSRCLVAT